MRDLGTLAAGLRQIRLASEHFLLRGEIEDLIIGPILLDGVLRAIDQAPAGPPSTRRRSAQRNGPRRWRARSRRRPHPGQLADHDR